MDKTATYLKRGAKTAAVLLAMGSMPVWGQPAVECQSVKIADPQPFWISSAAFVAARDRIAVVDPLRNNLLLVSPKGERTEAYDQQLVQPEDQMVPTIIDQTNDGFLLSMVDQRLYMLDSNLKPKGNAQNLIKASTGPHGTIVTNYDSVYSRDELLSFGAVRECSGKFQFGFFRVPLKAPTNFEFLKAVSGGYLDYYLRGHRYLVGLENGAEYGLIMSPNPVIVQFPAKGAARPLAVIPDRYRHVPPLKVKPTGPKSEEAMYKELESLTIPVGLYADGGQGGRDAFLYLLTREPKGNGETLWNLIQIDPRRGRAVGGPFPLPTTAQHLTIVTSPENWYVFEKGSVEPTGKQPIDSLLVIPSSLIRSRSVPAACRSRLK